MTVMDSSSRATSIAALAVEALVGLALAETAAAQAGVPATGAARAAGSEQTAQRAVLEEIFVVARHREAPLQDTSISVTALSGATLRSAGMTDSMEVGRLVPNVNMATAQAGSGTARSAQVFIRGVGQLDYLFTTDPGVGIYVDGVYYPRTVGAVMDLLDLQRVEVLRGPQGTLYGKNAIGGAINLIAAKPDAQPAAYAEVTAGDFDRRDFRGMLNVPLEADKTFVRLAASVANRDGYGSTLDFVTGAKTAETGDEHRRALRATLRRVVSDDTTLDLAIEHVRVQERGVPTTLLQFDDSGAFGGVPGLLWNALVGLPSGQPMSSRFVAPSSDTSYATGPNRNSLDQYGAALTITTAVRGVELKSISAYREFESSFGRDGDGSPLTYVETLNEQGSRVASQELQLFGEWGSRGAEWLAGVFLLSEFGRDLNHVRLTPGLYSALEDLPMQVDGSPCAPPFSSPGCRGNPHNLFFDLDLEVFNEIDIDSVSIYGHTRVPVARRLGVAAGVRYTRDDKRYTLSIERLTAGVFSVPRTTLRDSWTAATPTVALEFVPSSDLLVYLSASRGFKSGGFNGRVNTDAAEAQSFDPEFLWSYELGLKSEWLEHRLRLNAALFSADYDDLQFTAASFDEDSGALRLIVDNVARAAVTGFELEVQTQATANLRVGIAVGRTDFRFTALDPTVVGITIDSHHPRTPEWTSSATLDYTWQWTDRTRLRFGAYWSYESESFADVGNTPSIARHANRLVNARLAAEVPGSGWEFALVGTNVTNQRFIVNGVQGLNSIGTAEGFANRPREWSLSVRKDFR